MTIKWSVAFKTGDSEIDEQHKALFNFINDLIEADTTEELTRSLMILYGYTRGHFAYEESVMRKVGIPKDVHDRHVHSHNYLITLLNDISTEVAKGFLDISDIGVLVTEWCVTHIPVMDVQLAAYLIAHNRRTELF
jgi:hemerythrin